MENQKALEILKALIDQAIKRGVFENAETVLSVSEAFNTIAKQIIDKDKQNEQ